MRLWEHDLVSAKISPGRNLAGPHQRSHLREAATWGEGGPNQTPGTGPWHLSDTGPEAAQPAAGLHPTCAAARCDLRLRNGV